MIRIRNSPFIGFKLNESLDIAVNKKETDQTIKQKQNKKDLFVSKVVNNKIVKTDFATNISIHYGKAETLL